MKFIILFLLSTTAMAQYPRAVVKCNVHDPKASARFHAAQDAYIDKLLRLIEKLRVKPETAVSVRRSEKKDRHMLTAYAGLGSSGLNEADEVDGVTVTSQIDMVGGGTYHYRVWESIHISGGILVPFEDPASISTLFGVGSSW